MGFAYEAHTSNYTGDQVNGALGGDCGTKKEPTSMDYMPLDANKATDEEGTQEANYSALGVKKWKRLARKSHNEAQPK